MQIEYDRIWFCSYQLFLHQIAKVSVGVQHIFSVEIDADKRRFIMDAHGSNSGMHLFGDVSIFGSPPDSKHYCYTCCEEHSIPSSIDFLAAGPSCKNLSKMFADRSNFKECIFPACSHFCCSRIAYCTVT